MGTWKKEDEGLPNSIPIWYIQLAPVVLATTTGFTSSTKYCTILVAYTVILLG